MKRRSTRKSSASAFLSSPAPPPLSAEAVAARSPKISPEVQFDFNLNGFNGIGTSSRMTNNKGGGAGATTSKLVKTSGISTSPQRTLKSASSISDLKDLASSNLESIKRHLERSHSEISKDIEASECRLQKRFKIQTQACQQAMDEAEKEYKKMLERINESRDTMKDSYSEFIAEEQATASRFCKVSIPELLQTLEKGFTSLRSQYGIPSTGS